MKPIANYSDEPLRNEQFQVFIKIIDLMETIDDRKYLLSNLITESEAAYICQRLNILRMLAKNFSYSQISDKLGVSATTISNANKVLDSGGPRLRKLLLGYKYKEYVVNDSKSPGKPLVNPHYPGAIKF